MKENLAATRARGMADVAWPDETSLTLMKMRFVLPWCHWVPSEGSTFASAKTWLPLHWKHHCFLASSLPHQPVPYPQGPKHCQLLGLVFVEMGLLTLQHGFAETPLSSGAPKQGLLRQDPSCRPALGDAQQGSHGQFSPWASIRAAITWLMQQDLWFWTPSSSNSPSDKLRLQIVSKMSASLLFLFSLKNMGQGCFSQLLRWTLIPQQQTGRNYQIL